MTHRPIACFLEDLIERSPNATVRILATGLSEVQPLRNDLTREQYESLVYTLLHRAVTPSALQQSPPDVPNEPGAVSEGPGPLLRAASVRLVIEVEQPPLQPPPRTSDIPVTVYLSDESVHEQAEDTLQDLLAGVGLQIDSRDEPIIGSWFRRMSAGAKEVMQSPAGREAVLTATHVADSRLVLYQDAQTTALLLQNLGPVITALQPTKDAVIRIGALLVVKLDWTVQIFQLTAAQQAVLDHQPDLAMKPQEILTALQLPSVGPQLGEAPTEPDDAAAS